MQVSHNNRALFLFSLFDLMLAKHMEYVTNLFATHNWRAVVGPKYCPIIATHSPTDRLIVVPQFSLPHFVHRSVFQRRYHGIFHHMFQIERLQRTVLQSNFLAPPPTIIAVIDIDIGIAITVGFPAVVAGDALSCRNAACVGVVDDFRLYELT